MADILGELQVRLVKASLFFFSILDSKLVVKKFVLLTPNLKALVKRFEKSGDHVDDDSDAMTTQVYFVRLFVKKDQIFGTIIYKCVRIL